MSGFMQPNLVMIPAGIQLGLQACAILFLTFGAYTAVDNTFHFIASHDTLAGLLHSEYYKLWSLG
jgi:hypothetical protein